MRIDVTAEPARLLGTESNILLAVTPFRGLPKDVIENGAFLATAPGLARPDPAVKTSDFIALREAWIAAHGEEDAYEHVMLGKEWRVARGNAEQCRLRQEGGAVRGTARCAAGGDPANGAGIGA